VPLGAFPLAEMVSVEVPFPGTLTGLNDALVRAGSPLTLNVVVAEKGPRAEMVTVYVAFELPAAVSVWLLGETEIEKSATVRVTGAVCVRVPLVAVIVSG
jgi:hypothetical protein